MKQSKSISAKELDRKFDAGEDVLEYFDLRKARSVNCQIQRVNVDFPAWMVNGLDEEATRLGITRQALIKTWIGSLLDEHHGSAKSAVDAYGIREKLAALSRARTKKKAVST